MTESHEEHVAVVNRMKQEVVTGRADPESICGRERLAEHSRALDAVDKGDLKRMFASYQLAVEERAKAEELFLTAAGMQAGEPPRDVGPVVAIRDVALAAISLAETVAIEKKER